MGAALVGLALDVDLDSYAPKVVLARMALVAHDKHIPPRYWGGWETLARTLGHVPSADGTWPTTAAEKAARRAVDRAIKQLRDAKYIERTKDPRPGQQAEYTLFIDGPPRVDNPPDAPRGASEPIDAKRGAN